MDKEYATSTINKLIKVVVTLQHSVQHLIPGEDGPVDKSICDAIIGCNSLAYMIRQSLGNQLIGITEHKDCEGPNPSNMSQCLHCNDKAVGYWYAFTYTETIQIRRFCNDQACKHASYTEIQKAIKDL